MSTRFMGSDFLVYDRRGFSEKAAAGFRFYGMIFRWCAGGTGVGSRDTGTGPESAGRGTMEKAEVKSKP